MGRSFDLLEWDTSLFGFPTARVHAPVAAKELPNVLAALRGEKVTLAYWQLEREDAEREARAVQEGGVLVDRKTTFAGACRAVLEAKASTSEAVSFTGAPSAVVALALEAGISSRFRVDPRMPRRHFEALYRIWAERSVRREIAHEVFVTGEPTDPTGLVTVGTKNGRVDIGLIAVSPAHRGRGLGRQLVLSAAEWGLANGYEDLQVVTQGDNTGACQLYERCGLRRETVQPVFHFWLTNEVPD